jgi:hypothetical protein
VQTATGILFRKGRPHAGEVRGVPVSENCDQRAAVRTAVRLVVADLNRVSGVLEEAATLWRRAGIHGQRPGFITPGSLQDAAGDVADALLLLAAADPEQQPALAFSAVAQLAGLASDVSRCASAAGDPRLGDAEMWAAVQRALAPARNQLWKLASSLARDGDRRPAEDVTATSDPPARKPAPRPGPPADRWAWQQALTTQRAAIDALPETEVRRLLGLIGGMEPAVLQRAAAAYTDIFCAVAEMKGSVAALRPIALAAPCRHAAEPGGWPEAIPP